MLSGGLIALILPVSITWLIVIIVILFDLFKRKELTINSKLLWTFLLLIFPFIGLIIYITTNKVKKFVVFSFVALLLSILVGTSAYYFIFYRPSHYTRDLTEEKAIIVTSKEIVKDFQTNEAEANKKYLNNVVEVTGEVIECKKDQEGHPTVTLKSDDAFSNVLVTLKGDKQLEAKGGSTITIKGLVTGNLSDVIINEAIVTKQ